MKSRADEDAELIEASGLFDRDWYLSQYPDVRAMGIDPARHYVWLGAHLRRDPSPRFDARWYLERNPDVAESGQNPLVHYLRFGQSEGRERRDRGSAEPPARFAAHVAADDAGSRPAPPPKSAPKSRSGVRGAIDSSTVPGRIQGWLARIGEETPRSGIVEVDGQRVDRCTANLFRADLLGGGINRGMHGFQVLVPLSFVDGRTHQVALIDEATGEQIARRELKWERKKDFTDFEGFLVHSMTSPMVYAPFREEDKRCFATMEGIARHLCGLANEAGDAPLVSVVMPVHNREVTVRSAVDSVLAQTWRNFELIIADDGSTDASLARLEDIEDPRLVILRGGERQGVSPARNRALEAAKGEIIAYLDSDNSWDERYLAATVGAFRAIGEADAVFGGQLLYETDAEAPFAVRYGHFNRALLENRNYIDLNCFAHKRALLERVGPFNTGLRRYVDYDLILRMARAGRIFSVPVLLSHYFFSRAENTISKDSALAGDEKLVVEKNRAAAEEEARAPVVSTRRKRRPVSIVIPSFEAFEDIQACLAAIDALDKAVPVETVVVDNGSGEEVLAFLDEAAAAGRIRLVKNPANYGFTKAVNVGIEQSAPESDILLLNNDALLSPLSVVRLQDAAHGRKDRAIAVPRQVLPGGTKTINEHVPFAIPHRDCDVNLSAHHENIVNPPLFHDGRLVELSFAPFFCAYIKRETIDQAGLLDAEFGRHYRSDRLYCNHVRHILGQRIVYVADAIVMHGLQKSTDQLRQTGDTERFDTMFRKNQWEATLAEEFGYRTAAWDQ